MNFLSMILQIVDTDTSSGIIASLVENIVSQGPFAALFLLITLYLGWRLYKKEQEVTELNNYIRENDKENLKTLNDVNNTLDKVLENQKNSNDSVGKEIQNTKEYIGLKIDNLADKIESVDDKVDRLK